MNNTLGIEYAYTRIHKLEVEALAYKDKIAELEKDKAFLLTQRFMGNTIVSTDQALSDAIKAHNLEQQIKGVDDLNNHFLNDYDWKWLGEEGSAVGFVDVGMAVNSYIKKMNKIKGGAE
jgi:uncharacterized Fe-S cluster-containing MiaB family protein